MKAFPANATCIQNKIPRLRRRTPADLRHTTIKSKKPPWNRPPLNAKESRRRSVKLRGHGERGGWRWLEGGKEESVECRRTKAAEEAEGRQGFQLDGANSDPEFILSISARWSGKELASSARRSLY